MSGERAILTYRDYEALPADGRRYELHDGALSVTPAPSPRHQRVSSALNSILRPHVAIRGLGEVLCAPIDVILADSPTSSTWIRPGNTSSVTGASKARRRWPIEILSPSTTPIDRGIKADLYRRYGVPYYWIVDADGRTVEAYGLAEGRYTLLARVSGAGLVSLPPLPDLAFVPASLWP